MAYSVKNVTYLTFITVVLVWLPKNNYDNETITNCWDHISCLNSSLDATHGFSKTGQILSTQHYNFSAMTTSEVLLTCSLMVALNGMLM